MLAVVFPLAAVANTDPLSGLLVEPGTSDLVVMIRSERSPYQGAGVRRDLVPLYLYEGERFLLHASRAGLKVSDDGRHRVDLFLDYRFQDFPYDHIPASLAGMQTREPTHGPRRVVRLPGGLGYARSRVRARRAERD